MIYNWAEGRPDELSFCQWWYEANWNINGGIDSTTAYVLPSIEGTKQKKSNPITKIWRFDQWKTWWNIKRRGLTTNFRTVADMDVYQPSDLLLIGALSHISRAGRIGVSTGSATEVLNPTTYSL